MTSSPVKRPATYEDLLQVPDGLVAEILDGELHASPRPAMPHALATSTLSTELGGPFQQGRGGPGGWWILYEPELHFGSDVLIPDLAGWKRGRVAHAWLVNPTVRTLEVLRRQGKDCLLPATHAGDAVVRAEPFEAVELDLLLLWGEARSPQER